MAEDWASDVKKYAPGADDKVIAKIVSYCGIALRKRDSSMVSFTDPVETGRVRDNYCRKKLGLTDSDSDVDAAIEAVGKRMSGDTTRNRVTVYYLLAEAFGKLSLFGGSSVTAAAIPPGSIGAGAAALMAATPTAAKPAAATPAVAAPATQAPAPVSNEHDHHSVAAAAKGQWNGYGGLAAKVLGGFAVIVFTGALLGNLIGGGLDPQLDPNPLPAYQGPETTASVTAAAAPAAPDGAGVTAQTVEEKPLVSVYFDTGKTDVVPAFATVAAPIKAWIDTHPADRLAVSGFNDPTGNAALNAELSKNRAKAVATALAGIGVSADRIDLVKPPETTDTDTDMSQARRVDIVVKGS